MAVYNSPIVINAGETYPGPTSPGSITWTSNGSPVNLSGYTATLKMRGQISDATPTLSISTTSNAQGSIVLGGSAGTVTININAATTAALTFPTGPNTSTGQYALNLTAPGGAVIDFAQGAVYVVPSPNY